MPRWMSIPLALLALVAIPLHAQRLVPSPLALAEAASPAPTAPMIAVPRETTPKVGLMVLGGVAGGVAGILAGGTLGAKVRENACEDCFLPGLIYGAVAGGSATLPLGVHLANGRRGSYGTSLAASLAIGGAGLGLAALTGEYGILLAVPVAQIASSVFIERATSR